VLVFYLSSWAALGNRRGVHVLLAEKRWA